VTEQLFLCRNTQDCAPPIRKEIGTNLSRNWRTRSVLARLGPVPTLTRRLDPDSRNCWQIWYGDIHAGAIARAVGNPGNAERWNWHCGFYPGSEPGDCTSGSADTFPEARDAFLNAWAIFLSKRTEADFEEWRHKRDSTAWLYRMWDEGTKLPTQVTSGQARCFCGAEITAATMPAHIDQCHRLGQTP